MSFARIAPELGALLLAFAFSLPAQLSPLDKPAAKDKPAAPSNALDAKDLEFYVRHLFVYDDRIQIDVGEYKPSNVPGLLETTVRASFKLAAKEHKFLVSEDGKYLLEGETYEIARNPFHRVNQTINTLNAPGFGTAGASVALVVYSDFQCPYCAEEAKILRNQLRREYGERLRVYFRDFPLASHDWAKEAAVAGRCIYMQEPDVFWEFHDWIFSNQKSITKENLAAKIADFAAGQTLLDSLELVQCQSGDGASKQVEQSIAEGQAVGVNSTPTLFVNGRRMPGSTKWDQLKSVIDYELDYQAITGNAGDDCGCAAEVAFPE